MRPDIDAIRGRVERARPGPALPTCSVCNQPKSPLGRDPGILMDYCAHECDGHRMDPLPGRLWPGESDPDALDDLLAHARSDIPALLEYVGELEGKVDQLEGMIRRFLGDSNDT